VLGVTSPRSTKKHNYRILDEKGIVDADTELSSLEVVPRVPEKEVRGRGRGRGRGRRRRREKERGERRCEH
jgi:hypothetical protein